MKNSTKIGVAGVIGLVVVAVGIQSSPKGLSSVISNSPGIISGRGTSTDPLKIAIKTDGLSITGTGSAGSALSANATVATLDFGMFGDGVDGSSSPCGVISTDTSLSRTVYCENLTVNSGVVLNPNGWRIFVRGTLTLDGKIARNGLPATTAGTGGASTGGLNELCNGGAGGNTSGVAAGGAGPGTCQGTQGINPDECSNAGGLANGGAGSRCKGGGGGVGGTYGGAAGGTLNVAPASLGSWRNSYTAITMKPGSGRQAAGVFGGGSGGGGGGGADFAPCNGQGGGGGGGAGAILIVAKIIVGTGSIEAKGGAGKNAGTNGGRCGGGGGGGGGTVAVIIGSGSYPPVDVTGGLGGLGAGVPAGGNGGNGGDGVVLKMKAGI